MSNQLYFGLIITPEDNDPYQAGKWGIHCLFSVFPYYNAVAEFLFISASYSVVNVLLKDQNI
jgi:hypothetical protein